MEEASCHWCLEKTLLSSYRERLPLLWKSFEGIHLSETIAISSFLPLVEREMKRVRAESTTMARTISRSSIVGTVTEKDEM